MLPILALQVQLFYIVEASIKKILYSLSLFSFNILVMEINKQMHTHLSLLNLKHGMLVNFKVALMKEGIHRIFNNFGKEEMFVKP